jgi:hypothetical protein
MDSCSSSTIRTTRYPRAPDVCVQGSPGLVVLDDILFVLLILFYKKKVY